jgi:hypothetical protein
MTVEEARKVDFAALEPQSGDMRLIICDHLDWTENEGEHLILLQEKLNSYLAFIESGEIYTKLPNAIGKRIVIEVTGKFPLSDEARKFYRLAGGAIEDAGFSLRFEHVKSE